MSQFVNFTFSALKEEQNSKGEIKKKIVGMPNWKSISECNHSKYIKKNHQGHAIITGEISGITVIDFDIESVYNNLVKENPELKNYKTIKTKNGYHIYCLYDADIKTSTDCFHSIKGVDIRNDDSIVFAPPCVRECLDGSKFIYTDLGGDILPVPKCFKDNMKQYSNAILPSVLPSEIPSVLPSEIPSVSISVKPNETDKSKWSDLLDIVILNDVKDRKKWMMICGCMKSNGFSEKDWLNFCLTHKLNMDKEKMELFDKIKDYKLDIFWLQKLAKDTNPEKYKIWVNEKRDIKTAKSDNEAGEMILEELKDNLIYVNGQIFLKQDHIWIYENEKIEAYLINYILKSGIKKSIKIKGEDAEVIYCENLGNANNIYKTLIFKLKTTDYNNIYDKFHSTTKNRICFLDGVLDFKAKKFYKWDEVNFEYYTTTMIQRKFGEYFAKPNKKVMDEVNENIFKTLFGDKIETAYQFLARGITANVEDKNFSTYLGNRDCGKGVLYELLKKTFEEYVDTFELGNILCQRNTDTNEVSRKLYWLIDLQFKRIAISQETPTIETGLKLSGKLMKKLAGGGDTIVARRNYDRVDTHFKLDTTFFMMGNDYLDVDVKDTNEHRIEFNSVISFKTEEYIEKLRENKVNDLIISAYKVKDTSIKDKCKTDDYADAFVMLLFENWKDEAVAIVKEIDEQEIDSLRKNILNNFCLTGNKEDYVLVETLTTDLNENIKKINNELVALGLKKERLNGGNDRNKYCYKKMKKIVDEPV